MTLLKESGRERSHRGFCQKAISLKLHFQSQSSSALLAPSSTQQQQQPRCLVKRKRKTTLIKFHFIRTIIFFPPMKFSHLIIRSRIESLISFGIFSSFSLSLCLAYLRRTFRTRRYCLLCYSNGESIEEVEDRRGNKTRGN